MQFTPEGIFTAIVTPFTAADEFDEPAFRRLIDFQVAQGAAGLLVIGGSGEFVSLTPSERGIAVALKVESLNRAEMFDDSSEHCLNLSGGVGGLRNFL